MVVANIVTALKYETIAIISAFLIVKLVLPFLTGTFDIEPGFEFVTTVITLLVYTFVIFGVVVVPILIVIYGDEGGVSG